MFMKECARTFLEVLKTPFSKQREIFSSLCDICTFCLKTIFWTIVCWFVCVEALCSSQQFFSHVGPEPTLPRFNQYCRE